MPSTLFFTDNPQLNGGKSGRVIDSFGRPIAYIQGTPASASLDLFTLAGAPQGSAPRGSFGGGGSWTPGGSYEYIQAL